jgi:hypothetical protein
MVIVVPTGDDHPANRSLAAALKDPAEIVVVPKDWPRLAPSV